MQHLSKTLGQYDAYLIHFARRNAMRFSRFAIFLVYFWFGALKVFSTSPASPLVHDLLSMTMPGVPFGSFMVVLGIFEMIVGLLFIIPHLERLAFFFVLVHLCTAIMPLFLLPEHTWQGFMMPTLEGQYIIKNILLVAVALGVLAHTHLSRREK